VEDDKAIREVITDLLEMSGYSVETANNGKDALNQLASVKILPELILLDLMMPVMDGFEFRKQQTKDHRISEIPVLVMSADGHVTDKQERISAQGYLRKPLDVDHFLETIERVIKRT
jgi:CheY-like chemotaxis protein